MIRRPAPCPISLALMLLGALPAGAAGLDREESELPTALRPSGLAAWERRLEARQYRFGVPIDCSGVGCHGSAESPSGSTSEKGGGSFDSGGRESRS